jgi:acetate kinase
MNVLIFNCGSSSQSFSVYQVKANAERESIISGKANGVATRTQSLPRIDWKIGEKTGSMTTDLSTHRLAAIEIINILMQNKIEVDAVGHRFVHGGAAFVQTTKVDKPVLAQLKECFPLAPIHNPNSYSVIEVCQMQLPNIPQYAVFDSAFHASMPEAAKRYAIPREIAKEFGLRKYGFHGLSYQYVSLKTAAFLHKPLTELKLILCHLGTGGASVTAIKDGHSIETSMGYSPLPGLVMSTRSGDIDAEVVLELVRRGYSADEVSKLLNTQSGLIGLSGFSSNLSEVIEEGNRGNEDCQIAFDAYANRLRFYLGAYTWLLNGADAIVFTDEIGVKSWKLREEVCSGVENLGVCLDGQANRTAPSDRESIVSLAESRSKILVIPTDEESVILDEVIAQLQLK